MTTPYNLEESKSMFLKQVHAYVQYWTKLDGPKTCEERLEGLAFSILALIDGSSVEVPKYILVPDPHPDDREYRIKQGQRYYLDAPWCEHDLSGDLHEHFANNTL